MGDNLHRKPKRLTQLYFQLYRCVSDKSDRPNSALGTHRNILATAEEFG